ncbi:MAG: phytanoyl-CoA dioxygenase family protein [Acidobacteriia bacterium]|nr:phytanoyl-CoA dioxygenase family protein [Terriglobia bacterium]
MTQDHRSQLDQLGYCHLHGFLDSARVRELNRRVEELFAEEGDGAGSEFRQEEGARRLANVAGKGALFRECIAMPEILEFVEHVLGPDCKLSSLNVRSANPRNGICQPLHADVGAVADAAGYWVCNTVWMLDDFTAENGAIRVVPGSHIWRKLPQDVMLNPADAHPEERLITGHAGDVVVMNAHAWHSGTANRTANARRAMHGFYCRRDKPQQQYQKRLLRPEVQQGLSPRLRHLLALDDPLNDELSAAGSGSSGFLK